MIPFLLYQDCKKQLADVEAVDYFFAQSLCNLADDSLLPEDFFLLLALSRAQRMGNSCLSLTDIAGQRRFTYSDQPDSGWAFESLTQLQKRAEQLALHPALFAQIKYADNRLYSARYWQFEQELVAAIAQRCQPLTLSAVQIEKLKEIWPCLFDVARQTDQDWQQVATALCVNRPFAMLTGGPGTGKTYTIARLLVALQAVCDGKLSVVLTAPTGKAAQRLSESMQMALSAFAEYDQLAPYTEALSQPAMTLHRLLGMPRWGINTRINSDNPIHADVIVVDESSMIDLALMTRLFRGLSPHTRVILVGDPRQLPSVETGNVLADIIEAVDTSESEGVMLSAAQQFEAICPHLPTLTVSASAEVLPSVHFGLQQAKRFGGELAAAAEAINKGDVDTIWSTLSRVDGSQAVKQSGVDVCAVNQFEQHFEQLAKHWFEGIGRASTLAEAMDRLQSVRWLTPFRQGSLGAEALNNRIQALFNRGALQQRFYPGRPVMILENHHGQRLYNGDVGLIWPDSTGQLKAWFIGRQGELRAVSTMRLPRHETVYAMTIHKSQGSEFAHLMLCLPEAPSIQAEEIYTRELVYTGLTRAKRGAVIVADRSVVVSAVARQQQRKTGLVEKLRTAFSSQ